MDLQVGAVLEGKVTGITKFGAFVSLQDGKSGLVHISEVANAYVSDVHDHVQIGQTVKVKVLNITDDGKINLSIKRALPPEEKPMPEKKRFDRRPEIKRPTSAPASADGPSENNDFENRLKKFMQESESRIADNKMYSERRQRSRRD